MISYNNPYLLLNADLDRGSAEMDRLMAGIWWPGKRLVNILTLVWPEPEVQVDGEGLLRVGDGDGLDLLGAEVDLDELGDGVANLKKKKKIYSVKIIVQKNCSIAYTISSRIILTCLASFAIQDSVSSAGVVSFPGIVFVF